MHVIVITNGDITNIKIFNKMIQESDYVICADGAARYLSEIDIVPDMLVGDFDSIDKEQIDWMVARGVNLSRFPREKDKTDTELALDYAIEMSPSNITIIGAIGSRVDHSLGNILLLNRMLDRNILGRIVGEDLEIYLINDSLYLKGEYGDIISLIPLANRVEGVTINDVLYPLNNATMSLGSTWGISNEFMDNPDVKISLTEGLLLVVKTRE